jgi:DNA mismatch repair ATPase MutL
MELLANSQQPPSAVPAVAALPPASLIDAYSERAQSPVPAAPQSEEPSPVLDVAPAVVAAIPQVQVDVAVPRFLGLLHHAYWVCELPDGLGVIDPYVLRERVVRHAIHAGMADGPLPNQPLLLPAIVAFEVQARAAILAQVETLGVLGCDIEAFDGLNIALKSVPDALHTFDAEALLREIGDACTSASVDVTVLVAVLARHEASAMDVAIQSEEVEELLCASTEVGMGSSVDPPCALAAFDLDQLDAAFKAR